MAHVTAFVTVVVTAHFDDDGDLTLRDQADQALRDELGSYEINDINIIDLAE